MSQSLILFGRELVGTLALPEVNAQSLQQTDRCRIMGPDHMVLPPLFAGMPMSATAPQTARAQSGGFGVTASGYNARGPEERKLRSSWHPGGVIEDSQWPSERGHCAATSSTVAQRPIDWSSPSRSIGRSNHGYTPRGTGAMSPGSPARGVGNGSPGPVGPPRSNGEDSPSPRRAFFTGAPRPGTEERRSGHIAAMDPTTLPKIYSSICKTDVQTASEMLDEAGRLAAEHRRECRTEAEKRGRKKAVFWRKLRMQRLRKEQAMAREISERDEREREAVAAQAKHVADVRWKKAFQRITTRRISQERVQQSLGSVASNFLSAWSRNKGGPTSGAVKRESILESPDPGAGQNEGELSTARPTRIIARSLTWRVKEVPLDIHIELLRKIQKLRNRTARYTESYEARKTRFARLPEEERHMCEVAFLQFGPDPYIRTLDAFGTREALYEIGARGVLAEETAIVFRICLEAVGQAARIAKNLQNISAGSHEGHDELPPDVRAACAKGGINLYTFACVVLPSIRKKLETLRHARIEQEFFSKDPTSSGLISFQCCYDLISAISFLDVEYAEMWQHALELWEHAEQKDDESKGGSSPFAQEMTSLAAQSHKLKEARENAEDKAKKQKQLNMTQTKKLVTELTTHTLRKACTKERKIQADMRIDRETFRMMRCDLIPVYDRYKRITFDCQRPLTRAECAKMFQELGLPTAGCAEHVGDTGIYFEDILHVIEQVRHDIESDGFDHLRDAFEGYHKTNQISKRLPPMEIEMFLSTLGLNGRTRAEKEAFARSLQDVMITSTYEDDCLNFEHVKRVLQRAREYVRRKEHTEELQVALACGFQENELEELHDTFDALDTDKNGTIETDEAWSAIKTLGFRISKAVFGGVFAIIDDDGSGSLDFLEFVRLLQLIRDREGAFAANRQIDKLEDLLRAEMLHLLTHFQLNLEGEAEHIDDRTLLSRIAELCGCNAHESLQKKLHVTTYQDLCTAADTLIAKQLQ